MSMEPEVTRVTGETTRKFLEFNCQEIREDGTPRVNEAAMEPTAAELLEQERVEKAMRGEEIIVGLEAMRQSAQEEEEQWSVGGRSGSILKSTSHLRRLLSTTQSKSAETEPKDS